MKRQQVQMKTECNSIGSVTNNEWCSVNTDPVVKSKKQKDYHKIVPCCVCKKNMRSDNLKRHIDAVHSNFIILTDLEMEKVIKKRKYAMEMQAAIENKLVMIGLEQGVSSEYLFEKLIPTVDECMEKINRQIKLGKVINNLMLDGCATKETLPIGWEEALYTYCNIEL